MAFEPYLSERNLGCYSGVRCPENPFDPECKVEEARQLARDRWNVLRSDPCQRGLLKPYETCNILRDDHQPSASESILAKDLCGRKCSVETDAICPPSLYVRGQTTYDRDFQYPKSHNVVDDCCTTPCPCEDSFPQLPTNIYYCATEKETCPPLEDCTTYKHFYVPHAVQRRPPKQSAPWDPCECPMEECTITRTDFTAKTPIPNGPVAPELLKFGPWSTDQFCREFTDQTTTGLDFQHKCAERRGLLKYDDNLKVCSDCPMRDDTMTRVDFRPKIPSDPCYPPWILNDEYRKPDTNLERCTTYKHFYKPYPILAPLQSLKVQKPDAIPFCTTNKLCYSCHDPEPMQKPPVEMRDNDPWPNCKRTPIRYTDNLQTDPCAKFCDATIYKSDYFAKTTCGRVKSLRPATGYVPCLVPLNDDTTMKISYPPYTPSQYKYAVGNAGNPNGIFWGPFTCQGEDDKCLPRFIAPYGNPLKPFINSPRCPCGPFDNRSSYNKDFIFRNREMVELEEESMCREVNVPKGSSLYRSSFTTPFGKKAAAMPPPSSKGYRCMNPCSIRDTDTLYRIDYYDFNKSMPAEKLNFYRGRSTKPEKKEDKSSCNPSDDDVDTKVVFCPVYPENMNKKAPVPEPPRISEEETGIPQAYRQIPYSGADILNRAEKAAVCHGY